MRSYTLFHTRLLGKLRDTYPQVKAGVLHPGTQWYMDGIVLCREARGGSKLGRLHTVLHPDDATQELVRA